MERARHSLGGPRPVLLGPVVNSSPFLTQWIMDVLICNGLGIYCGMKTLEWLSLKTYKWQGLWNIPTYKYILGVIEGKEPQSIGPPRTRPCYLGGWQARH